MTIDYDNMADEIASDSIVFDPVTYRKHIAGFLRRIASEAKAEQREQDCASLCQFCASDVAAFTDGDIKEWWHALPRGEFDVNIQPCNASAIRAQATEE